MKFSLLFLVGLFYSLTAHSTVIINAELSRTLGLWSFMESICQTGHRPSKILKDKFLESQFSKDKKILKTIAEYKNLRDNNFNHSYSFDGYPKSRGEMSWILLGSFEYQASQSKNLKEFQSRTARLLAPAEHYQLFQLLATIEPIYDELIWQPNFPKLTQYSSKLLSVWNAGKLSELYSKTILFYHSQWPSNPVFSIHLIPIPGNKGHTSATVINDAILLEALLDEDDLPMRVGVIFHELSHAAYEAQNKTFQIELDTWFNSNTSKDTPFAHELLNEGLATAIGNGLAYKFITGKDDKSSWYNDEEIDQGAKTNYDLVRSYVLSTKEMDKEFVDKWISGYTRRFPNAYKLTSKRLRESVMLTDSTVIKPSDARTVLKNLFKIGSLYSSSPLAEKDSLDSIKEAGKAASLIIIFNPNELSQLKQLSKHVPDLSSALPLLEHHSSKSRLVSYVTDERAIIIFQVDSPENFLSLAKKLKEMKELSDKPEIVAEI